MRARSANACGAPCLRVSAVNSLFSSAASTIATARPFAILVSLRHSRENVNDLSIRTLVMIPMFRSFAAEGDEAKPSPPQHDPPAAEDEMTDASHHRCTRAWYLRPPVWIAGVIVAALAVFGIVELSKG